MRRVVVCTPCVRSSGARRTAVVAEAMAAGKAIRRDRRTRHRSSKLMNYAPKIPGRRPNVTDSRCFASVAQGPQLQRRTSCHASTNDNTHAGGAASAPGWLALRRVYGRGGARGQHGASVCRLCVLLPSCRVSSHLLAPIQRGRSARTS
jgi:hypothetical protein